jgi:hypothetical protein
MVNITINPEGILLQPYSSQELYTSNSLFAVNFSWTVTIRYHHDHEPLPPWTITTMNYDHDEPSLPRTIATMNYQKLRFMSYLCWSWTIRMRERVLMGIGRRSRRYCPRVSPAKSYLSSCGSARPSVDALPTLTLPTLRALERYEMLWCICSLWAPYAVGFLSRCPRRCARRPQKCSSP